MIPNLASVVANPSTVQRAKRLHWRDVLLVVCVAALALMCLVMIAGDTRNLREEQGRIDEMIGLAENALMLNAKGQQVDQAKSAWLFALLAHDGASTRLATADGAYRGALAEFEFALNSLATSAAKDEWTQELIHILRRESAANAALYQDLYRQVVDAPDAQLVNARDTLATEGQRLSESVSALVQTLSMNFSRQAKLIQAESIRQAQELRMRLSILMIAALILMALLGWFLHRTRANLHGEMDELERDALTDPLTAIPNVRAFKTMLLKAMEKSRRKNDMLTLVLIDLDHFKLFNDTHGHPAGDRLLTQAASDWSVLLPESASLSRIGGEEFALILPSTSSVEAEVLVRRMLIATPEGQTFSAGISLYTPGEDATSFVARADRALYRAKREGRNRVSGEACPSRTSLAYASN